jgi:hypothetical protein
MLYSPISGLAQVYAYAKQPDPATVSPVRLKAPQNVTYKITYPPGFRMRNVGRTLTILGAGVLIGGIVVFHNADKTIYTYQTSTGTYNEVDPKVALGVLMVMGGTGMTVPGIILWSKGARKFNRYLEQQTACVFNGTSVSLQYRF